MHARITSVPDKGKRPYARACVPNRIVPPIMDSVCQTVISLSCIKTAKHIITQNNAAGHNTGTLVSDAEDLDEIPTESSDGAPNRRKVGHDNETSFPERIHRPTVDSKQIKYPCQCNCLIS